MPIFRAQVILPFFTNLPEDVVVNQFHFFAAIDDIDEVGDEIFTNLQQFYQTCYGASATNRANYIDWTRIVVKVFNLEDPTPRIPWVSPFMAFSAGTASTSVPTEVACVLSFHAAPESGVRFQRLYNRIYLGGLSNAWMTNSAVDEFPRLNTSQLNVVITAAELLWTLGEAGGARWRQYSEAGGAPINRVIVGGWVDNSPDTQRRRSVLATSRNPWSVP